jgi:hypothetical protein
MFHQELSVTYGHVPTSPFASHLLQYTLQISPPSLPTLSNGRQHWPEMHCTAKSVGQATRGRSDEQDLIS